MTCILIDDDSLVRQLWKIGFKSSEVELVVFKTVEEFIELEKVYSRECIIYIDSDLGNGLKGEIESEKLHNLGFKNLYLATGHQKSEIDCPDWIKEIVGKEVPRIK